jgi:hypothetical protein
MYELIKFWLIFPYLIWKFIKYVFVPSLMMLIFVAITHAITFSLLGFNIPLLSIIFVIVFVSFIVLLLFSHWGFF